MSYTNVIRVWANTSCTTMNGTTVGCPSDRSEMNPLPDTRAYSLYTESPTQYQGTMKTEGLAHAHCMPDLTYVHETLANQSSGSCIVGNVYMWVSVVLVFGGQFLLLASGTCAHSNYFETQVSFKSKV